MGHSASCTEPILHKGTSDKHRHGNDTLIDTVYSQGSAEPHHSPSRSLHEHQCSRGSRRRSSRSSKSASKRELRPPSADHFQSSGGNERADSEPPSREAALARSSSAARASRSALDELWECVASSLDAHLAWLVGRGHSLEEHDIETVTQAAAARDAYGLQRSIRAIRASESVPLPVEDQIDHLCLIEEQHIVYKELEDAIRRADVDDIELWLDEGARFSADMTIERRYCQSLREVLQQFAADSEHAVFTTCSRSTEETRTGGSCDGTPFTTASSGAGDVENTTANSGAHDVENEGNVYLDESFPFDDFPSFAAENQESVQQVWWEQLELAFSLQDANAALEAVAMLESSGELDAESAGEVRTEVERMAQQDSHSSTSRQSSNSNAHVTRSKAPPARRTIPARGPRRPIPDLETHTSEGHPTSLPTPPQAMSSHTKGEWWDRVMPPSPRDQRPSPSTIPAPRYRYIPPSSFNTLAEPNENSDTEDDVPGAYFPHPQREAATVQAKHTARGETQNSETRKCEPRMGVGVFRKESLWKRHMNVMTARRLRGQHMASEVNTSPVSSKAQNCSRFGTNTGGRSSQSGPQQAMPKGPSTARPKSMPAWRPQAVGENAPAEHEVNFETPPPSPVTAQRGFAARHSTASNADAKQQQHVRPPKCPSRLQNQTHSQKGPSGVHQAPRESSAASMQSDVHTSPHQHAATSHESRSSAPKSFPSKPNSYARTDAASKAANPASGVRSGRPFSKDTSSPQPEPPPPKQSPKPPPRPSPPPPKPTPPKPPPKPHPPGTTPKPESHDSRHGANANHRPSSRPGTGSGVPPGPTSGSASSSGARSCPGASSSARPSHGLSPAHAAAAEILELPANFTIEDVRAAYKKAAMKWHPDRPAWRAGGEEGVRKATEMFQRVKSAYDLLSGKGSGS